jgi:hypothetical protein
MKDVPFSRWCALGTHAVQVDRKPVAMTPSLDQSVSQRQIRGPGESRS